MKFNFKKISAVAASALMAGMSIGVAAAASFPAPFVDNGVADVAVVYGTGVGVSVLDFTQAGNIQSALGDEMPSTSTTTVTDGDSYKFEKTSTKFHLGDHFVNITTTIDDDDSELPTLLADGKYIDNDNDEIDFTQKIVMGSLGQLTMFEDNDYMEDVPTVGFRIPSAQEVLTYTMTFGDTLYMTDMPTSDLPIMGKNYYVLSNTTSTLTLLDSATETVLSEGETSTVEGKTVSIEFIGSAEVKMNVDGEVTNSLNEGDTYKLQDGSYIGIKDILYDSKDTGVSKVEFSIGNGKLKLTDGGSTDVQINDEAISGLTSDFDLSANVLSSLNLTWSADEDLFITEDTEAIMPGFEVVKLSYGGLNYPAEEVIEVKQGGDTYARLENFPLKDGKVDIDFLYGDSTSFTGIGKDATNLLVTDAANDGNITFDKDTDEYFVVSWTNTDEAESYLMRATNFVLDGSDNKADIEYYKDGTWTSKKTGVKATDTFQIGSVDLTVGAIDRTGKSIELWKTNSDTLTSITSFNTLYSEEGMTVYLPWENNTAFNISNATEYTAAQACGIATALGYNNEVGEIYTGTVTYNSSTHAEASTSACQTTFTLKTVEEDKSENKYSGDTINLTIGWDSSSTAEVEVSDIVGEEVTFQEIEDTDVWRSFMYSALATEILWDKSSSGQKSVKLMYHGDEVAADVFITSADATVTSSGASALGDILVKDSEVSSVASKNLIIVGGSCINSAAAKVLGVADHTCGAAFTEATGVGAGEFLIKGVQDAYTAGKLALVVAGYEEADTVNAATYLTMKSVDTSKEYKGTSATNAELVVA